MSNTPTDNAWLDDVLEQVFHYGVGTNSSDIVGNDKAYLNLKTHAVKTAKQAILTHIDTVCREARKQGYIEGGIDAINRPYRGEV